MDAQREKGLMNLYHIVDYLMVIQVGNLKERIMLANVNNKGGKNHNLKLEVFKYIHFTFTFNDALLQGLELLRLQYSLLKPGDITITMRMLGQLFKNIGATRCYYTCLQAEEVYAAWVIVKDAHKHNFDLNSLWTLYPTLIEFLVEYMFYLRFEFQLLLKDKERDLSKQFVGGQ